MEDLGRPSLLRATSDDLIAVHDAVDTEVLRQSYLRRNSWRALHDRALEDYSPLVSPVPEQGADGGGARVAAEGDPATPAAPATPRGPASPNEPGSARDGPARPPEAAPAPLAFQPRELRGRYTLTGSLGRGSYGSVYQATDNIANRTVAIKHVEVRQLQQRRALGSNSAAECRWAHRPACCPPCRAEHLRRHDERQAPAARAPHPPHAWAPEHHRTDRGRRATQYVQVPGNPAPPRATPPPRVLHTPAPRVPACVPASVQQRWAS
jgi:hypothetical protein